MVSLEYRHAQAEIRTDNFHGYDLRAGVCFLGNRFQGSIGPSLRGGLLDARTFPRMPDNVFPIYGLAVVRVAEAVGTF
jgi:hypothetical protein